jgi:hypothetical protein
MGTTFTFKEEVHRERPQSGRLPASFINRLRAVSAYNGYHEPQAQRIMHREAETEPAAFLTSYSGRSKQGPKRDGPVAVTPTAPRGETINQGGASSSKM